MNTGTKSETLYESLTGVGNVGELIKIGTGTWEVHKPLQGGQYRSREVKRRAWMAESAVVVMKRVTNVEQRAGRE